MTRKTKGIAETRKYLRITSKNCMDAFMMGYNDGASGHTRQPFPNTKQSNDEMGRAVQTFARELYKRGFDFGKEENA